MRMSDRTSRVTLGEVVQILAFVVTFGGYVLTVGAIVAWLDVHAIGVPTLSVVSDMPRNELLGLGFETLLVWLALGIAFTGALAWAGSRSGEKPVPMFGTFGAGILLPAVAFAIGLIGTPWLQVVAWLAWGIAFAALVVFLAEGEISEAREMVREVGPEFALGAAIGVLLGLLLIEPGSWKGLGSAIGAVLIGGWIVGEALSRRVLHESVSRGEQHFREEDRKARLTALASGVPSEVMRAHDEEMLEEREAHRAQTARRERHSVVRSAIAIVLLAAVLGCGAIVSRSSHDFWAARVTLTNGTCASGTLLVRNSDEVLLAGLKHKAVGGQVENRLVEIPASVISNVQVIGPRGPARRFKAESCAKAASDLHPRSFAPYPLVGESSTPEADPPVSAVPGPQGREGKEGKRGPKGEPGPQGKRGVEGARGTTGKTGKAGQPGETGGTGKTGPRGKIGPTGNIGPTGMTGATGRPGVRGERGPPGSRGERGSKGERGERGPRGFSSVGGS
jgi:MFS family permease